ncbi:MAG: Fe-S cluster assembly ATPase SufC [Kiritimatiellae bacterium]|jgi:Fe-S cluster assembly ATP-binding protein|nr:Fe-S cluster assembly ATPase SufC [Kiritimatiellia bacterium]MDY0149848.1 Fe-S cluster assembly ATPase SufC [Kiritimatiellia bacterium]
MLRIQSLSARIKEGPAILHGIDLEIKPGEIHAIMGPNGSGKSTLARILAGHPDYDVTGGNILYKVGDDWRSLLKLESHERAWLGLFLAFQYPVDVPGVSNTAFLHASYNAIRRFRKEPEMDIVEFRDLLIEKIALIGMEPAYLERAVNLDFSGGEKKRNEILQMAVLAPQLAVLDETDSGLDVDSLRIVAEAVKELHTRHNAVLLITHYQRMLNYITPDHVHIMMDGRLVRSGDADLARSVEDRGYDWLKVPA